MTSDGRNGYWPLGKNATTPRGKPLRVPSLHIAEAIAKATDPRQLALGIAMRAIDRTEDEHAAAAETLAQGLAGDMLLYRVEEPEELAQLQRDTWDPVLAWGSDLIGATLEPVVEIRPVGGEALESAEEYIRRLDGYKLAALEAGTMHTDSLLLGVGLIEGRLNVQEAWEMSVVEVVWQEKRWGVDEDAWTAREERRREYCVAADLLAKLGK